ncbi:MAG: hypothetical protein QN720_06745 [Nitrososphaeraceae archaeon]|nr:hypothetical protein [Nitrososphaeraceae archaeon]MDW0332651.1 hypothetical protein [Nitrososphaeraceae archaeon]
MALEPVEEMISNEGQREGDQAEDPYSLFLFSLRSPKTREKCVGRPRMFIYFVVFA